MKEAMDQQDAPRVQALHWLGDNFGAAQPAIVDVQDCTGRVLHLNVSEAIKHLADIDDAGRQRIEAGLGVAMVQALTCMQACAKGGGPV